MTRQRASLRRQRVQAILVLLGLVSVIGIPVGVSIYRDFSEKTPVGASCTTDRDCRGFGRFCLLRDGPRRFLTTDRQHFPQGARGMCSKACRTDTECRQPYSCREVARYVVEPGGFVSGSPSTDRACM